MSIEWNIFERITNKKFYAGRFIQRFKDSMGVIFGNFSPWTENSELGLFDYLTLGIPRMMIGFSRWLWEYIQDEFSLFEKTVNSDLPGIVIPIFLLLNLINLLYDLAGFGFILAATVFANLLKATASAAVWLVTTPLVAATHIFGLLYQWSLNLSIKGLWVKMVEQHPSGMIPGGTKHADILAALNEDRDTRFLSVRPEHYDRTDWSDLAITETLSFGTMLSQKSSAEQEDLVIEPLFYPDKNIAALGVFKLISQQNYDDAKGELEGVIELNADNKSGIQSLFFAEKELKASDYFVTATTSYAHMDRLDDIERRVCAI